MLDTLEAMLCDDLAVVALDLYFSRVDDLGDDGRERFLFTGAVYDTLGGRGDAPDVAGRFTAADIAAVTTLSVKVHRRAVVDLLYDRADEFAEALDAIPTDVPLWKADDRVIDAVSGLQHLMTGPLGKLHDVAHVTRSKLLARKRPHLIPIRDQHVLRALVGRTDADFLVPLRDTLRADRDRDRDPEGHGRVIGRAKTLREHVGRPHLSVLRVIDIVVWMRTHGAASVDIDLEQLPVRDRRAGLIENLKLAAGQVHAAGDRIAEIADRITVDPDA